MEIGIVYFSLSGRTETLSYLLKKVIEQENFNVSVVRLETKQTGNFLKNCIDAFTQKNVKLQLVPDIKKFDVIFLCTPVWAFNITPAIRSFLNLSDMSGKKVFLLITYGSGKGKEQAMDNFENLVKKSGGEVIGKFYVKGKKVKEEFYIIQGGIKKCLREFQQIRHPGQ